MNGCKLNYMEDRNYPSMLQYSSKPTRASANPHLIPVSCCSACGIFRVLVRGLQTTSTRGGPQVTAAATATRGLLQTTLVSTLVCNVTGPATVTALTHIHATTPDTTPTIARTIASTRVV